MPPHPLETERPRSRTLLALLEQAYDHPAWHGANLRNAIRRLSPEAAAYRPQASRHNPHEIVVHCAYWKYRVVRHLVAGPVRFELKGSDWFPRGDAPDARGWDEDRALLHEWHARLLEAVRAFPEARLDEIPGRDRWSHADLIAGGAAHDLYHAGQIRLLARMHRDA